jgi:hypothetical protein
MYRPNRIESEGQLLPHPFRRRPFLPFQNRAPTVDALRVCVAIQPLKINPYISLVIINNLHHKMLDTIVQKSNLKKSKMLAIFIFTL